MGGGPDHAHTLEHWLVSLGEAWSSTSSVSRSTRCRPAMERWAASAASIMCWMRTSCAARARIGPRGHGARAVARKRKRRVTRAFAHPTELVIDKRGPPSPGPRRGGFETRPYNFRTFVEHRQRRPDRRAPAAKLALRTLTQRRGFALRSRSRRRHQGCDFPPFSPSAIPC